MFSFQLGKRSEEAIEKINLARDALANDVAVGEGRERPLRKVLYENYTYGACKDLSEFWSCFDKRGKGSAHPRSLSPAVALSLWSVSPPSLSTRVLPPTSDPSPQLLPPLSSLQDYAFSRGISSVPHCVPLIVQKCVDAIEARGTSLLHQPFLSICRVFSLQLPRLADYRRGMHGRPGMTSEGLYRISPRSSAVQALVHLIEKGPSVSRRRTPTSLTNLSTSR